MGTLSRLEEIEMHVAMVMIGGEAGVYRHRQNLFLLAFLDCPDVLAEPCVLGAGRTGERLGWRGATAYSAVGRR